MVSNISRWVPLFERMSERITPARLSLVFQHHEADILDRNALLHVGGFSGVNDHLIVPQTQTERCRKEECAFEHGGQRLNLISPVTVRSKSSCSTQALNWVCKIEITGR